MVHVFCLLCVLFVPNDFAPAYFGLTSVSDVS